MPTPSLSLHEFSLKNEIDDKSKYTDVWNNPYMCRILMNATYLRNLILHKWEYFKTRGEYQKLPKEK